MQPPFYGLITHLWGTFSPLLLGFIAFCQEHDYRVPYAFRSRQQGKIFLPPYAGGSPYQRPVLRNVKKLRQLIYFSFRSDFPIDRRLETPYIKVAHSSVLLQHRMVKKGCGLAYEARSVLSIDKTETAGFEPAGEYESPMPCKGTPLSHSGTSPTFSPDGWCLQGTHQGSLLSGSLLSSSSKSGLGLGSGSAKSS